MEVTHRDHRYLMRMMTKKTRLYTEMIVDRKLLHQTDEKKLRNFLAYDNSQHPLAVQLGGNDPESMGKAADLCRSWGYDEVNLNCGCPSAKVSKNQFGARLMLNPQLVRRIVHEMIRRVGHDTPVTVKCRLGADDVDSYEELCNFVKVVSMAGADHFIVHARKCLLSGLSTKQNRSIPPLKYDWVHRLKRDFPDKRISLNGGITDLDTAAKHLGCRHEHDLYSHNETDLDSVMIGRAAWHNPWIFSDADRRIFGEPKNPCSGLTRLDIINEFVAYGQKRLDEDEFALARYISAPIVSLMNGVQHVKAFRTYVNRQVSRKIGRRDIVAIVNEGLALIPGDACERLYDRVL